MPSTLPAAATISGDGVSPAANAAASGSPPGSAACTLSGVGGRFAGSGSKQQRITFSTAGSTSAATLVMLLRCIACRMSSTCCTQAGLYWRNFGDEMGDVPQEFANNLAVGAIAHLEEIDALIKQRAENWRISRMAVVDRNILRLAIYEFLYEADTPKTVVINEALEIA